MKNRLFKTILSPVMIGSLLPMFTIASCAENNNLNEITQKVYDTAIETFMEFAPIPRATNEDGHTDSLNAIGNYLLEKGKKYGAEGSAHIDAAGNVWFDIPATAGCENYKSLVLQSHMDMVAVCDTTKPGYENWDKFKDSIATPVIETINGEEVMHTENYCTSLGTDNGVGMALEISLAVNQNLFKHGLIRCLFTTNEEKGTPGAATLGTMSDKTKINVLDHEKGFDYLINLDATPDGHICWNAAGNWATTLSKKGLASETKTSTNLYTLKIENCHGGHSGLEANKNRINPIILAMNILKSINGDNKNVQIASFITPEGAYNSIPQAAIVQFIDNGGKGLDKIKQIANKLFTEEKQTHNDPDATCDVTSEVSSSAQCVTTDVTTTFIDYISKVKVGVITAYPDKSPKASGNLGSVSITNNSTNGSLDFELQFSNRYQEMDAFVDVFDEYSDWMIDFAKDLEATTTFPGGTKPWKGFENGNMCNILFNGWLQQHMSPVKERVHAGLEAAEFTKYNKYIDIASTGCDNQNEHQCTETLHLNSYKRLINTIVYTALHMNF